MLTPAVLPPLLVVCLCAQWCRVCGEYRAVFEQLQARLQAEGVPVAFSWLDIEDEAELLEPLDVENFPTLLLAQGSTARFFGAITPHPGTLERLVRNALQDPAQAGLPDPEVQALVARVQRWAAARC